MLGIYGGGGGSDSWHDKKTQVPTAESGKRTRGGDSWHGKKTQVTTESGKPTRDGS